MPRPISTYWWTNVGMPMVEPDRTRVLAPVDYVVAGTWGRARLAMGGEVTFLPVALLYESLE